MVKHFLFYDLAKLEYRKKCFNEFRGLFIMNIRPANYSKKGYVKRI